jgi:progressive ankylosis protein
MSYGRLTRFLLPLAVTAIVLELGQQFLSAGMARVPQATQTLAAYGLAWGLVLFLASPLGQVKELGLVLVNSPQSWRKVRRFVLLLGAALVCVAATLTFGPIGHAVIERLHGVDSELGTVVRFALLLLIPFPLIKGMTLFHAGLLLRMRRTALVSYAMLANLAVSVVAVFVLLPLPFVRQRPILLPVLVIYAGLLVQFGITVWGAYRYQNRLFALETTAPAASGPLSFADIARFFWPLALIMLIQEMSRPLINLFVARGPDATAALAILAVLYTLGRIPYGWLNELRNLAPAFREEPRSMDTIRRFALACSIVSFGMMLVMFWSPLRDVILERLIGVDAGLAERARTPLLIFSFYSFIVATRAYFHGIGLRERRTRAMAPSAPARIIAILSALIILPQLGVTGATLGIAALTAGFAVETVTVWWGVQGRQTLLANRRADSHHYAQPSPK